MLLFLLMATDPIQQPTATNFFELGIQQFLLGKNNEARTALTEGLLQLDPTNPKHLEAAVYLGAVLDELSEHEKAQSTLENCIQNYKEYQPNNKVGLAFALMHLGKTLSQRGQYANSADALQKSIDLYEVCNDSQKTNLIKANTLMAETYMYSGTYSQAEPYFKTVIASYTEGDPQILWARLRLARLYMFTGNYQGAKPIFEEGISVLRSGTDKDKLGWNLFYLGDVYRSLELFDQAERTMQEGFAAFAVCDYAPDHQITQWGQAYYGRLLCDLGKHAEAQPILEESLYVHEAKYGENSKRNGFIMQALANAYANLGMMKAADLLFKTTLSVYEKQFGTQHTEYALVLCDYGQFALQKNNALAVERLTQALSVLRAANHSGTTRCAGYLEEATAQGTK